MYLSGYSAVESVNHAHFIIQENFISAKISRLMPKGASAIKIQTLTIRLSPPGSRFDSQLVFSLQIEPSPCVKKVYVHALPKVVGFLWVLRFSLTGELTGWVR